MNVELTWDKRMLRHVKSKGGHPERPKRLLAVQDALVKSGLLNQISIQGCTRATRKELELVHTKSYLDYLENKLDGSSGQLTKDTYFSKWSLDAAIVAAGAAAGMARESLAEKHPPFRMALCRPPGHHAGRDYCRGFCIINNAAMAATAALEAGARRVAILDWDAHHGNGTEEIFYHRRDVLVLSCHRHPYFPFTGSPNRRGEGKGRGFNVNVPLQKGDGDNAFHYILSRVFIPILRAYRPDIIILSAGFDAHSFELLGGLEVTENGFGKLTSLLLETAHQICSGRVIAVLEGGYDPDGLSACVCEVVKTALDETPSDWIERDVPTRLVHCSAMGMRSSFLENIFGV